MFPPIEIRVGGLQPEVIYNIVLEMKCVDDSIQILQLQMGKIKQTNNRWSFQTRILDTSRRSENGILLDEGKSFF
jgi:hypothetical protein